MRRSAATPGTAEGVGFAVPINAAKRSMRQLIENGEVRYAWLGITTQTVTPRLAEHFGYAADGGAAVQEVVDESPADRPAWRGGKEEAFEGLPFRPGGDLIVAIDGARSTPPTMSCAPWRSSFARQRDG